MTAPAGPTLVPDWRRIPGDKARRYENVRTGEVLSRRQYDQQFGRVAKTGFRTYEEMAEANKHKWKGFYVQRFPVVRGDVERSWRQLISRIRELGHRRMYVSAHGEAGYDYPSQAGQMIWVSSSGFYADSVTIGDTRFSEREGMWLWGQLAVGALITDTIDEFVLRWLP